MTNFSQKPKKSKKAATLGAFKSPRIYIDPSDFYLMRRRACLTTLEASQLLDVTHKTLQNWEKGRVRIPYAAFRTLKIKVGYVFNDEHFKDWFVKDDTLWSPEGRGFKPYELQYIGNYFWMANRWLAERRAAKTQPQASEAHHIERGAASNGSPTLRVGTLPLDGAVPLHEAPQKLDMPHSLQDRPPLFEKFLRDIGITDNVGNYFR